MSKLNSTGIKAKLERTYLDLATSGKINETDSSLIYAVYNASRNFGRSYERQNIVIDGIIQDALANSNISRNGLAAVGKLLNVRKDHVQRSEGTSRQIRNIESVLTGSLETRRYAFKSAPKKNSDSPTISADVKMPETHLDVTAYGLSATQYSELATPVIEDRDVIARITPTQNHKRNSDLSDSEDIYTDGKAEVKRTEWKRTAGFALATLALAACSYVSPVKEKLAGIFHRNQNANQLESSVNLPSPTFDDASTSQILESEDSEKDSRLRSEFFGALGLSLEEKCSGEIKNSQTSQSRQSASSILRGETQVANNPIQSLEYELAQPPKPLEGDEAIYFEPISMCSNQNQISTIDNSRYEALETQLAQERLNTTESLAQLSSALTQDLTEQAKSYELRIAELNSQLLQPSQISENPQVPEVTYDVSPKKDEFDLLPDSFPHIPAAESLSMERPEISTQSKLETEIIIKPNPTVELRPIDSIGEYFDRYRQFSVSSDENLGHNSRVSRENWEFAKEDVRELGREVLGNKETKKRGLFQNVGRFLVRGIGGTLYNLVDALTTDRFLPNNIYPDEKPIKRIGLNGRDGIQGIGGALGNTINGARDIVETGKHTGLTITNAPRPIIARNNEGVNKAYDWIFQVPLEWASNVVEGEGFTNIIGGNGLAPENLISLSDFHRKKGVGVPLELGGAIWGIYSGFSNGGEDNPISGSSGGIGGSPGGSPIGSGGIGGIPGGAP